MVVKIEKPDEELTPNERILRLGKLGEDYVKEMIGAQGHVIEGTNWNDNKKDATVAKTMIVEIKTQRPWSREDAFTVKHDQFTKCSGADYVYFVSVLDYEWPHSSAGHVYRIPGKKWKEMQYKLKPRDDRSMLAIKVFHCEYVGKLPKHQADRLAKLANSGKKKYG